jgi:5-formyltetrahydrofolate cyclo-ligase
MTKSELRTKYKKLRRMLSEDEREDRSVAIANNVLSLPIWEKENFHVFLPIEVQNEVNTQNILHLLAGKDKKVIVSKSDFATCEMQHFLLTDETVIRINRFGIPEPERGVEIQVSAIDVVFVPLLAFDLKGQRIGYGKGFYDRFLAGCNPDVIKIGLSFFEAETSFNDIHVADVLLNFCVTPKKIYRF